MSDWIKHNKKKIIISSAVVLSLTAAFFLAEKPPAEVAEISDISNEQISEEIFETSEKVSLVSAPEIPAKQESSEKSKPKELSEISGELSRAVSSVVSDISKYVSTDGSISEESEVSTEISVSEHVSETTEIEISEISQEISSVPIQQSEIQLSDNTESSLKTSIQKTEESETSEIVVSNPDTKSEAEIVSSVPEISESKTRCTLSISCSALLNNLDKVKKNKLSVIPADGWILNVTSAEFEEGESVFDVTKRICIENRIPFEFTMTPVYNTAYIEGIDNIYEFDCGSGSGWMYRVNGEFLSYGCSECKLKEGDIIEWVYTCNLGKDVGEQYNG